MSRRRLDQLLVRRGYAPSRTRAQELIASGAVHVRGFPQTKASTQVDDEAPLQIRRTEREWVSRGAHKLLQGLAAFPVTVTDKVCLDVGASTGGFTEVLLERGARRVYAVDVGYGQLAWKLREDSRVIVMERTNARFLCEEDLGERVDLVVSDASFISLRLLLPALERVGRAQCDWILLVKPQFEAGKERVGNGVITDKALHETLLLELRDFISAETSLFLVGATTSPIRGPKGNMEFLFHLRREGKALGPSRLRELVAEAHGLFCGSCSFLEGKSP